MTNGLTIGDVHVGGRALMAPMTGVSDLPFRRAASRLGAAYVATEMVACESLVRGRPDVVRRAAVGDGLPLTVIQLVGCEAEWMARGAALAEAAGADIIDINMGCPSKEVTGRLSGSALMQNLDHAERLIDAAVDATARPVTLKIRLGWDNASRNAPELAMRAERSGVKAITVHGRTRQQFYKGAADWQGVSEVAAATSLPVIVNGDITDLRSAREALAQSGARAVMIGRGAYGRPWIATALDKALITGEALVEPHLEELLEIVLEHLTESLRFYGDALGLKVFRKHLGWYIENAPCPSSLEARKAAKSQLCRMTCASELTQALTSFWTRVDQ